MRARFARESALARRDVTPTQRAGPLVTTRFGQHGLSWSRQTLSPPAHRVSNLVGAASLLACACFLGWLAAFPSDVRYLAVVPLAALLVAWVVAMPYPALVVSLCLGVVAPEYIALSIGILPGLNVTPTLLVAVAIALCGLRIAFLGGSGLRPTWALGALLSFCAVWYLGAVFTTTVGHDVRGWNALLQSPVPSLALVGGFLASGTPGGRRSFILGLSASATLAAALAIVEAATGQNVFIRLAQGLGFVHRIAGSGIIPLPSGNLGRYGLARAEGAFSHPLMLGAFLVLGLLATLAWRSHQAHANRVISFAVGIQLLGLMATVSRGPIAIGLLFVVLWIALERRNRASSRVAVPLIAGTLSLAALADAGIGGEALGFFGFSAQSSGPLTESTRYRVDLVDLMLRGWEHANAFGYADYTASPVFRGLSSLDNQLAFLLATRGLVGVLAWLALVVTPVAVAVGRQLEGLPGRRFVIVVPLAVLMLGMDIGFVGVFAVYLYGALGLCWGSLASSSPALARRDVSAVRPTSGPRLPSRGDSTGR